MLGKGAVGGAARLFIKAYRKERESNSNASDMEIFRTITKWRYGITGKHLDSVTAGTAARSKSLREYLKYIVVAERYPDSIGSEDIIREVIDEICDEEGGISNMTSENFIEKTQDVKNIEKYLYQKSTIIIKSLDTTKMNNFIKQWINEAVIVIFNELEEFLVLFNNEEESCGSLHLFKNPTSKSIDIYMKLNTIFLLILFKNTKSFDNILDWAGVEYDSFKETIFKYFNFSKELKLIYSDCVMFFENEAWKPFTSNLYRNLILLGFGKDSRLLSEDGLEEEMSKIWVEDINEAPLILKELFKNSYVKFYGYITDYLEKMAKMAREGK